MRSYSDVVSVSDPQVFTSSVSTSLNTPSASLGGLSYVKDDIRQGDGVTPLPYAADFTEHVPSVGKVAMRREKWTRPTPADPWVFNSWDDWQTPISMYNVTFPTLPDSSGELGALRGICETRLRSKAVGVVANVALLLAERKQTAALAKSLIQSVYSHTRAFIRRDWSELKRLTGRDRKDFIRNTTDRHLAFIYGIMPLMGEVNGLLGVAGEPVVGVVRVRESKTLSFSNRVSTTWATDLWNHRKEHPVPAHITRVVERELSARGVMRFRLRSEAVNTAAQLGVLSPSYVVYDRIALSFVIGWFTNISSYLVALDSFISVDPISFSVTTRSRDVSTYSASRRYSTSTQTVFTNTQYRATYTKGATSSYLTTSTKYVRHVGTIPSASLHLRDGFTAFAGLAAVSLLTQRYLSRMNKLHSRGSTPPGFRYKRTKTPYLPPIKYTKV